MKFTAKAGWKEFLKVYQSFFGSLKYVFFCLLFCLWFVSPDIFYYSQLAEQKYIIVVIIIIESEM